MSGAQRPRWGALSLARKRSRGAGAFEQEAVARGWRPLNSVAGPSLSGPPAKHGPPTGVPHLVRRLPALVLIPLVLLLVAPLEGSEAKRSVPPNFYGVVWNGDIKDAPASVREGQWANMRASGVESARTVFSWERAQPASGGPIDFSATDLDVEQAARHGIDLLPVILETPEWARAFPGIASSPPARSSDYAAYMRALVGRYGSSGSFWTARPDVPRRPVRAWQIWNEPSLRRSWYRPPSETGFASVAPRYGALLRAARGAVKSSDPGAKVVLAGLTNASWTDLQTLYRRGGIRGAFDVVAIHPFTSKPSGILTVARRVRAVLRRNGRAGATLWVTEMSWPASRGRVGAPPGLGGIPTTDSGMARRLTEAFSVLAKARRDREVSISRAYWYTWASSYRPDRSEGLFEYSGLGQFEGEVFTPKPALAAYRASAQRYQR